MTERETATALATTLVVLQASGQSGLEKARPRRCYTQLPGPRTSRCMRVLGSKHCTPRMITGQASYLAPVACSQTHPCDTIGPFALRFASIGRRGTRERPPGGSGAYDSERGRSDLSMPFASYATMTSS